MKVSHADLVICQERLGDILKELKEVLKMVDDLDKQEMDYLLTLPDDKRHSDRELEILVNMRFDVEALIKRLNRLVAGQPDTSAKSWWQFWEVGAKQLPQRAMVTARTQEGQELVDEYITQRQT